MPPPLQRLPVVIMPLDGDSERLAAQTMDRIMLAEPNLLNTGWACSMPRWSADTADESVRKFNKLLIPAELENPHYTQAFAPITLVVILLGHLSLHQACVLENLESFWKRLEPTGLLTNGQILPLAVLDIADFPGDGSISALNTLPTLTEHLTAIAWSPNVYLIHQHSDQGLALAERGDADESIRIFLEALILGQHWGGFTNSWLDEVEHLTGGPRYATVSSLCIETPQVQLREHLSHVAYHEALTLAATHPANSGENLTHSLPGRLSDDTEITPDPPNFTLKPTYPRFNEAMGQFLTRVEEARIEFTVSYESWRQTHRNNIHQSRRGLAQQARRQLQKHKKDLRTRVRKALAKKHFIFHLSNLQAQLENIPADKPGPHRNAKGNMWPDPDISTAAASSYSRVKILSQRMPNFINLIAHLAVAIGLAAWWLPQLISQFGVQDPELTSNWAWIVTATGAVIVIFLAWWVPKSQITSEFQNMTQRYTDAVEAVKTDHQSIVDSLAGHWTSKSRARAINATHQMSDHIALAIEYLTASKEAVLAKYEYPNEESIRAIAGKSSRARRVMETPGELMEVVKELHKCDDSVLDHLVDQLLLPDGDDLTKMIETECPEKITNILRSETQKLFASDKLVLEKHLEERLTKVVGDAGWEPAVLLPIVADLFGKRAKKYCACPQSWQDQLKNVLGDAANNFEWVGLKPQDRVYFFQVHYDINPHDVVNAIMEL